MLILKGGNVNDKDADGTPLIHLFASRNYFDACLVMWLVKLGANVNAVDTNNDNALKDFFNKTTTYVQVLINAGININHRNNQGQTPL